jgi:hypothetical protein
MKILSVVKVVSEIILVWSFLVYGFMRLDGASKCMEFKAPESVLSLKYGTICTIIVNGTQYAVPLSILQEKAESLDAS